MRIDTKLFDLVKNDLELYGATVWLIAEVTNRTVDYKLGVAFLNGVLWEITEIKDALPDNKEKK